MIVKEEAARPACDFFDHYHLDGSLELMLRGFVSHNTRQTRQRRRRRRRQHGRQLGRLRHHRHRHHHHQNKMPVWARRTACGRARE